MSQSLAQIYLHLVFSTKNREPFLRAPDLQAEIHAYLGGICRDLEAPALSVGGPEDHVHILCRHSRSITVANLLRDLKRASSIWVKERSSKLVGFRWQEGYGAFSISPSHVESLIAYIENQAEHHRRFSFQDELRKLCHKYGVQLDERYVWN